MQILIVYFSSIQVCIEKISSRNLKINSQHPTAISKLPDEIGSSGRKSRHVSSHQPRLYAAPRTYARKLHARFKFRVRAARAERIARNYTGEMQRTRNIELAAWGVLYSRGCKLTPTCRHEPPCLRRATGSCLSTPTLVYTFSSARVRSLGCFHNRSIAVFRDKRIIVMGFILRLGKRN